MLMTEVNQVTIEDIIIKQKENYPNCNEKLIRKAYEFANFHHGDQCRKSGEPYIIHPIAVAKIVLDDLNQTMHGMITEVLGKAGTVSAEQLRTGTALIVFFHTGCPDCQQTLPSVQKIYDEYKGEIGSALISREQGGDEIAAYWENKGYTMPYSAQTDRTVYHLFASSRVPRVYVCNNGFVKYTYDDSPIPSYSDLKGNMESF